jgi:hypothetical protein
MKRAIVLSFLLACSGVLLGDSPDSRSPSLEPPSLLQDLVRLTNGGFSDETILAYAKAHRVELPPKVTADDLLWLRKSGVSEAVTRYMAAIDVRASDAGAEEVVAYDSDETAGYSAGADSYSDYSSDSGYGSYPDNYYGSYPDSYYASYPDSYYNDYYPGYGAGYYPYPVYFFVNRSGFFGRFHRHGRGFEGPRGHVIGHGGVGRPRLPRGGFDRSLGGDRRSVVAGHRGPGRSLLPRGSVGQGFSGARGAVIRGGGGGHPGLPRASFGHGSSGPRGAVVRNGGLGSRGSPGGGHAAGSAGRGPVARSGGGHGGAGRPAAKGRR